MAISALNFLDKGKKIEFKYLFLICLMKCVLSPNRFLPKKKKEKIIELHPKNKA